MLRGRGFIVSLTISPSMRLDTRRGLTLLDRRTLWEIRARDIALLNNDIEALGNKVAKTLSLSLPGTPSASLCTQAIVESASLVDRLVTG
ncbi:MAG TPA: hypothetical protein VK752_20670 [Bryobacteraceae bacterium]|nr:hypothetical protein [Bryobacteraceae bacterium]